ncbi:MAG TPA: rhombosortase [Gammaproteobacteria bacterium]|nr:rhombosortase [Gammaproteobacteria bacterium]HIK70835.1 rhombosortase [Pseudomonadales bacterium]
MNGSPQSRELLIFGFVFVILGLGIFHQSINSLLEYNRTAISSGQIWRLVSCHFVHLNFLHTLLNTTGLILCFAVFGTPKNPVWSCIYLITLALFVSAGLFFFSPDVIYYLGLSGLLHGILIHYLIVGFNRHRLIHELGIAFVVLKLVIEQLPMFDVFYLQNYIGDRVITESHLYGAIGGLLWVVIQRQLTNAGQSTGH